MVQPCPLTYRSPFNPSNKKTISLIRFWRMHSVCWCVTIGLSVHSLTLWESFIFGFHGSALFTFLFMFMSLFCLFCMSCYFCMLFVLPNCLAFSVVDSSVSQSAWKFLTGLGINSQLMQIIYLLSLNCETLCSIIGHGYPFVLSRYFCCTSLYLVVIFSQGTFILNKDQSSQVLP